MVEYLHGKTSERKLRLSSRLHRPPMSSVACRRTRLTPRDWLSSPMPSKMQAEATRIYSLIAERRKQTMFADAGAWMQFWARSDYPENEKMRRHDRRISKHNSSEKR